MIQSVVKQWEENKLKIIILANKIFKRRCFFYSEINPKVSLEKKQKTFRKLKINLQVPFL